MVVVSAEPPTLDLNYFPGNAVTLTATFPADYLDTRTLRSFLGGRESPGVELDVDVTGDVATITLSAPQSLVFDASAAWELDIYSAPNYITFLTGTWIPGTSGEDAALNIDLTFDLPDSTTFTIDGNVGLPGPAGADGPDGLPGLNWLGAWDSGTAYAINDGVSLDGTSYIATAAGTNHTPPNVSYWDVLAEAGTDGLGVPPGGTTGQRLAKASNADNDTVWEDPAGGDVATVNGQTGNVVLDADDIDDSATTNKWTDAADIAKLAGIEPGAEVNDTAAEILTKLLTVDGSGSGLDADLLDGQSSTAFVMAADGGQEIVQAHGNTGATETIDVANGNVHIAAQDQACTYTFTNPASSTTACSFTLILTAVTGAATWPASVNWAGGVAPTLSGRCILTFITVNGGTDWDGFLAGSGLA